MATGTLKYVDDSGNVTPMYPTTILATAVTATSTDGVAYTATVAGISALTAGLSFTFVPSTVSTSATCTLNVNGLGAKTLRLRSTGYTATTVAPPAANWMASGKPVRVTYDGLWWVCDLLGDVESSGDDSEVFMVTISYSNIAFVGYTDTGLTADKTYAEIKAAHDAGQIVVARYTILNGYFLIPLMGITNGEAVFGMLAPNTPADCASINLRVCFRGRSDGNWSGYFNTEDAKPVATLVTLTVAGWSSTALTQSVTVSGILADESKQLIQPMPTAASMDAYRNAGIRCTGQAKDTLTFTCDTVPTAEISVYVTYQEVTVV